MFVETIIKLMVSLLPLLLAKSQFLHLRQNIFFGVLSLSIIARSIYRNIMIVIFNILKTELQKLQLLLHFKSHFCDFLVCGKKSGFTTQNCCILSVICWFNVVFDEAQQLNKFTKRFTTRNNDKNAPAFLKWYPPSSNRQHVMQVKIFFDTAKRQSSNE